jgi:multidrug efflux system outer membrane protein
MALLVLTTGCAVGPDYHRPDVIAVPEAFVADASADVSLGGVDRAWWTAFGSPELDALVDEALANNPDAAAAAARVLAARAQLDGANASRLPSVEIGGTASRSQTSRARFGGMGSFYQNFYTASASAAYELDLWGRLSRTRRAAWAAALASEVDRRTVQQALIADVVRGWLAVRESTDQLALARGTVAAYERSRDMVEDRYLAGVVSSVDLHLSRQTVSSASALAALREQELSAVRRGLEMLLGRYPAGALAADGPGVAELPALPPVPAGLPSDLLERRPDIQAAEMRLRSATESVGAAKAELFPKLAITGEYGYNSSLLEELLKDASSIWNLAGGLSMPLLNRGARTSQVDAARAGAAEAEAVYVKVVLNGFREVEAALTAERVQGERREHLRASAEHARRSLVVAEDRYRQGLDGFLSVLDTQRRLLQAEGDWLGAERAWRTSRVDLIQALGGDWDEGAPDESATNDDEPDGAVPSNR